MKLLIVSGYSTTFSIFFLRKNTMIRERKKCNRIYFEGSYVGRCTYRNLCHASSLFYLFPRYIWAITLPQCVCQSKDLCRLQFRGIIFDIFLYVYEWVYINYNMLHRYDAFRLIKQQKAFFLFFFGNFIRLVCVLRYGAFCICVMYGVCTMEKRSYFKLLISSHFSFFLYF